jgi:hypothetical protein
MFQMLDQSTSVQVVAPPVNCPPINCASRDGAVGAAAPSADSDSGGVEVVAHQTVGPYETVQLRSSDAGALRRWLDENGYDLPADIAPIVDAYVADGFDFLALKLVPGAGVNSMRPVRITTPGASPELPLRMVAAGTGAVTPITLWILGEGRYEPTNFSTFEIQAKDLVWNWDTQSSNYKSLRAQGFASASGKAWLVEAAEPLSVYSLRDTLLNFARYQPEQSGYADDMGRDAPELAEADLAALFSTLPEQSVWVTRIYGELARSALADDLQIGASMNQAMIERYLQTTNAVGAAPACPAPPPGCTDGSDPEGLKPGSCAMDSRPVAPLSFAVGVAVAALALARRRRP